ncbi:MAG: Bacterial regulatory protein luxR family [Phycisphaerales bacterium]|jgi:hypothetical protein|nr:Bacterial regulatory protein luxR family [Phycisphaerales bacterium]
MPDEVTDFLLEAWRRVRETLRNNPIDVAKRLRRGRDVWTKRPPRAWCLAIRASDTRITPMTARCEPEDAAYPREAMSPHLRTSSHAPHRVTVDATLLAMLTERVRVDGCGEPHEQLAQRLGRHKMGLRIARAKAKLKTYHESPTGGRGGNPRPIVSAGDSLDPGAHLFQRPDRAWGWTGILAPWRLPDDLPPQTIQRVPFCIDRTRAFIDKTNLHPEHPLVDPPPRKPSPYKLGKPLVIDNAQYKWKGEQFVGYDWRAAETNPLIRENYEFFQRRRERVRRWRKARAARGDANRPAGAGGGGSLLFRGWMWLCPICGRRSKVLFYPLPPVNVLRGYGTLREDDIIDAAFVLEPSLRQPPTPHFSGLACHKCHGVFTITRARNCAWNEIVTYLSGGLLYGHEVPTPSWFTPDRKREFRPCLGRAPSKRLPQIATLILRGLSYTQIARKLGITKDTVSGHVQRLYKLHKVRGRANLERKLAAETADAEPASLGDRS